MANFIPAITKVLKQEGALNSKLGYVNDPNDNGGETIAGIARKFHPHWEGWFIVDGYKKHPNFPYLLKHDDVLLHKIIRFYKPEFWDKIGGDKIKSQSIAELILSTAVLGGFVPAIKRAENIVGLDTTGVISQALIEKLSLL